MSLLTPAIRRRAFEQGSADALFGGRACIKDLVGAVPCVRMAGIRRTVGRCPAEEPAKGPDQEVTQGAPGSHSQMMGSGHSFNVLVESWRHP